MLFEVSGIEAVRGALPDAAVTALTYLTHLGDPAVLIALVSLFYWFGSSRRDGAYVAGAALGGLSLLVGLKGLFQRPRPPEEVALVVEHGYAFPSGHALGATVVYLLLAEHVRYGDRRARYAIAAAVIGTVAASRVLLGVHYPGDAVAGVTVGAAYFVAVHVVTRDPMKVFVFAFAVAAAAAVGGSRYYVGLSVGAPLGGLLTWSLLGERLRVAQISPGVMGVGAAAGLPAVLLIHVLLDGYTDSHVVDAVGYAVLTSIVLATPLAAQRVAEIAGSR